MPSSLRAVLRPYVPPVLVRAKQNLEGTIQRTRSEWPLVRFVARGPGKLRDRRRLARGFATIHRSVVAGHTHAELIEITEAILKLPPTVPGCLLEAGVFHGASAAKLSLVARLVGRPLIVCDSFEGLPVNDEPHDRTLDGVRVDFSAGQYRGTLHDVREVIGRYGDREICRFVKGWFEDTLPKLPPEPIAAAFIDVDLASSTRTCIRELYPRLSPGGVLFSHDGHLPLCIDAIRDPALWAALGRPPLIEGLGIRKLVRITKPHPTAP